MNNIIINTYSEKYHDQVQNVCIKTAPSVFTESEEMKQFLLTSFCNYYIEQEPTNCFTALDGDTVAGYIICTENSLKWAEDFERIYLNSIEDDNAINFHKSMMTLPLKYAKDYSAHLHIDILEEYQRGGIGFRLMDSLIEVLKAKNINGLMLVVNEKNEKGVSFYVKYGFQVLENAEGSVAMGIKLV